MAESSVVDPSEASPATLSELFQQGFSLHNVLESTSEPTNSPSYQHKVRKAILLLEDATRLVSILDLFSRNENVSEVSTESLKYFLLPALLGDLNSKLVDEHQQRLEVIRVVEAYYLDYLQRIKDYGVIGNFRIPEVSEPSEQHAAHASKADLARMNREREEKIRRYKETKQLEASLKDMQLVVDKADSAVDDETLRTYYKKLVQKFVYSTLDELATFAMEKPILKHMETVRHEEEHNPNKHNQHHPHHPHHHHHHHQKPENSRPLKPIIITRDAVQKEVFGMGYKNLPVLTVEEFYEQRARDGWFPQPAAQSSSRALQDNAKADQDQKLREEEEERIQEEKREQDDPEELERQRNFDEYKDDHKRGEGNKHNRG